VKSRATFVVLAIVVAAVLVGCAGPLSERGTPDRLAIDLQARRWAQGVPVKAQVVLKLGSRPRWMKRSIILDYYPPPPPRGTWYEAWVEVKRASGERDFPRCIIDFQFPDARSYEVVPPGESMTAEVEMSCFALAPGRYTLLASYWDRTAEKRPPPGVSALNEHLEAVETFEVLAAPRP
jgi:hypothetical protein